jgi:ribonuclease III
MRPAAALAERLGLPVRDLDLLQQALIHSSYLHEHRDLAAGHNERLEFLGDSVVSLAISDALYRRHPGDDEGVLSARRASIVSTAGLARLASRLDLGEYLLLGEGESQRGGRRRPALLASAFEALVGALYLDLGFGAAGGFVAALAGPELTSDRPLGALKSPKSRLQEYTQRVSGERPQYRLVDAVGPDHDKLFRVEAVVGGRVIGIGQGHSRRLAETEAAAYAIEALRRRAVERASDGVDAEELASFGGADAGNEEMPDEIDSSDVAAGGHVAREPWVEFDLTELGLASAHAVEEAGRAIREAVGGLQDPTPEPTPARTRKGR